MEPTARFVNDLGQLQVDARRCIHCGFCNSVCPTSNVSSSFKESRKSRGRVVLLQSLVEGTEALDPFDADFKELIDLCYSCRRCVEVCPAGIPIPDLMSKARFAYLNSKMMGLTIGHQIFASYGTFDSLGSKMAPLANAALGAKPLRTLFQAITHIDARARIPSFHVESFQSWFKKQPSTGHKKRAVYFVDSYANFNDPLLGKTVFSLLSSMGYQTLVPPQRESGMPAIEFGLHEKAAKIAEYNVHQLFPYAKEQVPIVCSSPAASFLLREGYPALIGGEESRVVAESTVDVAELMAHELDKGTIAFDRASAGDIVYHYCCLSKSLKLAPHTLKLLEAAGYSCRVVEDCCGGAGVWGTFKENYDVSGEIAGKLKGKLDPDEEILTESETCRLQIESRVTGKVRFPLEVLASRIRA